jgi:hypothetical protein
MTMQYYKPEGNLNVGDCMPFFHDGVFRFYYLMDEDHHGAVGDLGGHQWAQATTRDLVHWEHHPLAIPLTEQREGSICTGSTLYHEGTYYGFYATRMRDRTQHLSLATSRDGVHFEKTKPNPFASPPPGYGAYDYRDPMAFRDRDGRFHLLVTSLLEHPPIAGRGGCLAHLVSTDLAHWELQPPFIVPGLPEALECPDYFFWNGWYYLVFSNGGMARYRMSREPFGPWMRPKVETLDGPAARVMKTAAFGNDRRIGAAWLGSRYGNRDDGPFQFAGNALFREIVQHPDGTLGAKFPAEMTPRGVPASGIRIQPASDGVSVDGRIVRIAARQGLAVAACAGIPRNARLTLRVNPAPASATFGLRLSTTGTFDSGYDLNFAPVDGIARLHDQRLFGVEGLDQPFGLEIVLKDDIVDVCIDGRRTLVDRCPERRGAALLLYGQDAEVAFEIAEVAAL